MSERANIRGLQVIEQNVRSLYNALQPDDHTKRWQLNQCYRDIQSAASWLEAYHQGIAPVTEPMEIVETLDTDSNAVALDFVDRINYSDSFSITVDGGKYLVQLAA